MELARRFVDEHPLLGYTAVAGEAPRCRATTRKGDDVQAHAASTERLLPLPSAPRRNRGSRTRASRLAQGARSGRAQVPSISYAPTDAARRRRRRHIYRRRARHGGEAAHGEGADARRRTRGGVLAAVDACSPGASARAGAVTRFAHGMTVATNALLEGRFARTALVATEGFVDLVELGAPGAAPPLPALRGGAGAARAARAALRRAGARIGPPGRSSRSPGPRGGRCSRRSRRRSRGGRRGAAALLRAPRARARARRAVAARLPGVHVTLSHELVRHLSRVRARGHDGARRGALAARGAATSRELGQPRGAAGLPEPEVMQSSGGLDGAPPGRGHAALTVLSGPAGGVGGARLLASLAGGAGRAVLRHGRDLVRRLRDPTAARWRDRRARGRGRPARAARARHPHRRRRRRLDRLARPRRRAACRPAVGGRAPGTRVLRARRRAPTVTDANLLLGRLPARRRSAARWSSTRTPRGARVAALAQSCSSGSRSARRGIVRVAEAEMLRRAARDDGRARRRPARLRADGVRRRGAAARGRHGRGARASRACSARAPRGVLSALGLAAAPRAPRRLAHGDARGDARSTSASRRSASACSAGPTRSSGRRRRAGDARVRYELRYAGQSFELPVEVAEPASSGALVDAFGAAHERRYGYREERGRGRARRRSASRPGARRAGAAPGAPTSARGRRSAAVLDGARARSSGSRRPAGGHRDRRSRAVRAAGGDAARARRAGTGEVDEHGTVSSTHDPAAGIAAPRTPRRARVARPDRAPGALGALRAACEEMGAVLIRSAHSPTSRSAATPRRRCSTPTGRW